MGRVMASVAALLVLAGACGGDADDDIRTVLRTRALRNAESIEEIETVAASMCELFAAEAESAEERDEWARRIAQDLGRDLDDVVHDAAILVDRYCPEIAVGW